MQFWLKFQANNKKTGQVTGGGVCTMKQHMDLYTPKSCTVWMHNISSMKADI